jgi:hypothetical protein
MKLGRLGEFVQRKGYKAWKIGRRNWLQWNDGDETLMIRIVATAAKHERGSSSRVATSAPRSYGSGRRCLKFRTMNG